LVNQTFISRFNKPFYLINTARGPVVETQALVEALKSGKILGAGLDVIEYEETSFETTKSMLENEDFKYLSTCENVLMTPHIAGWTNESKIKLAEVLANKIIALKL
jgi:D-3-phosphoglycerate dehydrogenase